ncbi:MAG: tetratricopeptide (TPR) repeat protein [Planctomycetaceae bacterium]|jgi:tetratricopeptide (TPR) repeat protein
MSDASPGTVAGHDNFDEAESTFRALSRSLRRANGFSVLIAVCNTPVRQNELLDRLDADLGEVTLRVEAAADTDDVLALVESTLGENRPPAIMVTGLANGIRSADPIHPKLRALNHRREEWRESVPCPIVFWIPEFLLQPIAQQAPDFLDWRSGTFLFLDPLGTSFGSILGASDLASEPWRLTEEERRQRMAQLQEWLAATPTADSSDPATIRWSLELADHYLRLGEFDECFELAKELIARAKDEWSRSFAWGLIASILETRGEFDEALRIRREEQLPVFNRNGDLPAVAVTKWQIADVLHTLGERQDALRILTDEVLPYFEDCGEDRGKAITLGSIADLLEANGDLNEALRIHREETLPIFERLGDAHAMAITQGQIADILQGRGDLDKALRIHREETLPVFERLGDVREKAVVCGKIASVLQSQGNADEAVRILREDVVPVFKRLGMTRELSAAQYNLAVAFLDRREGADNRRAKELLEESLKTAEQLRLPEVDIIRELLRVAKRVR